MAHQLAWRELKGGIIAVAIIAVIVFSIFAFARVGGIHGKKVTLYVISDEAAGVLAGTEVWLSGEKDGVLTDISLRPPRIDAIERLLINTEFLKRALPHVRRHSHAETRA